MKILPIKILDLNIRIMSGWIKAINRNLYLFMPFSKKFLILWLEFLIFSNFLQEVQFGEIILSSCFFELNCLRIISIGIDEVFIIKTRVNELLLDNVLKLYKLLLLDINHLELSIEDVIIHMIQHLRFKTFQSHYDVIFEFIDSSIVFCAINQTLLIKYPQTYPQVLSLLQ